MLGAARPLVTLWQQCENSKKEADYVGINILFESLKILQLDGPPATNKWQTPSCIRALEVHFHSNLDPGCIHVPWSPSLMSNVCVSAAACTSVQRMYLPLCDCLTCTGKAGLQGKQYSGKFGTGAKVEFYTSLGRRGFCQIARRT